MESEAPMRVIIAQITAPHFVAGLELENGKVARIAAPIIGYMIGWTEANIQQYVKRKGWKYEPLKEIAT
jgi:hypothetical protein